MTKQEILTAFDALNVWKRGEQRAPHKPLLVLLALGKWQHSQVEIPFEEADPELTALLMEFGPTRKLYHPEFPFFHLQTDGVWTMQMVGTPTPRKGKTSYTRRELLKHHATGRFSDEVILALRRDPTLVGEIAGRVLAAHFPESLHADILAAVGLDTSCSISRRLRRDPTFRERILTAYEYRCAVCGFDVRLGSQTIALDAAHVKWFQAGGPDVETNGLALCVLHHKVFDLGAFTVSPKLIVLVSDKANGSAGLDEALLRFHGAPIRMAQRPEYRPNGAYLRWHSREVFKGKART